MLKSEGFKRESALAFKILEGMTEGSNEHTRQLAKCANLQKAYADALVEESDARVNLGKDGSIDPQLDGLRRRVSIGRYLTAALDGRKVDGAEEEFRLAVGAKERSIPIDAFPPTVTKADTATGAPDAGVNVAPVVPSVFAMSCAQFLGIAMPRVRSGKYSIPRISTDATASAKGKGDKQESSAIGFTMLTSEISRISSRITLRAEDLAQAGIPDWENSLVQNMQMVLADLLDVQILRGDNTGDNINGLATQLTADTAQSSANTFSNAASDLAGYVDGKYAPSLRDLRVIHNATVYSKLAAVFATNDDSVSHLDWCGRQMVEVKSNSNMKASVGNVGDSIVVRSGMADGMARTGAICPIWGDITISDPYSDSAAALTNISMHILLGDVLIQHPAMYQQWKVKTG